MVDVSVFIRGATDLLEPVEGALEGGSKGILKDLEFGVNEMQRSSSKPSIARVTAS